MSPNARTLHCNVLIIFCQIVFWFKHKHYFDLFCNEAAKHFCLGLRHCPRLWGICQRLCTVPHTCSGDFLIMKLNICNICTYKHLSKLSVESWLYCFKHTITDKRHYAKIFLNGFLDKCPLDWVCGCVVVLLICYKIFRV